MAFSAGSEKSNQVEREEGQEGAGTLGAVWGALRQNVMRR